MAIVSPAVAAPVDVSSACRTAENSTERRCRSRPATERDPLVLFREEMRNEYRRQAHLMHTLEIQVTEGLRACKEAISAEEQRREDLQNRLDTTWKASVMEEVALAVERRLEAQMGPLRADFFQALREVRHVLERGAAGADLLEEAARARAGSAVKSITGPGPSKPLSPLKEQPAQEQLARLDEAVEREAASRREVERRLRAQMDLMAQELRVGLEASLQQQLDAALGHIPGQDMGSFGGCTAPPEEEHPHGPEDPESTPRDPEAANLEELEKEHALRRTHQGLGDEFQRTEVDTRDAAGVQLREAGAPAAAVLVGAKEDEQERLSKAVACLEAQLASVQRDFHIALQQMGLQSSEILNALRAGGKL